MFDHVTTETKKMADNYYLVGLQHILLFERAWNLMGYENFMNALITDRIFIEELLDRITDYNIELAKHFVSLGVDAIRTGYDYGGQLNLQMSPTLWRQLFKPRLHKIWSVYRNAKVTVIHHSCGNIEEIIPDMIDIGLEMLHPVQPNARSLEHIANQFGHEIAFHGGIDTQKVLPFGTPKEVKHAVKECVKILGKNRQYVIAPSQEIMNDVPTANIVALLDGIQEYRY